MFNFPLEVALFAVVFAQFIKLPIQYLLEKKWYLSIIFSTGGMPSSHSAFVTALMIALALTEGITSPYFALSFVLAGVVIHDAIGIRREAGKHALVLNQMREEIDSIIVEMSKKDERDNVVIENKLKELLGHEPIEAIAGTILGAIVAVGAYFIYLY
jgi:acid phosphatase family membrane protein YuiD